VLNTFSTFSLFLSIFDCIIIEKPIIATSLEDAKTKTWPWGYVAAKNAHENEQNWVFMDVLIDISSRRGHSFQVP
jgi:hypothetical protein